MYIYIYIIIIKIYTCMLYNIYIYADSSFLRPGLKTRGVLLAK